MTSSRGSNPFAGAAKARPIRVEFGPNVFVKKGLSAFDPHDPYYFAISLGWRKFGLLFLVAELAINAVFAGLYCLQPGSIANQGHSGFLGAFFFSLETLATVGYGEMYPATTYAHVVSAIEILTGPAVHRDHDRPSLRALLQAEGQGAVCHPRRDHAAQRRADADAAHRQRAEYPSPRRQREPARAGAHDVDRRLPARRGGGSAPDAAAHPGLRDPLHHHARHRRSKPAPTDWWRRRPRSPTFVSS